MPLTLAKNTMTFESDSGQQQCVYKLTNAIVIAHDSQQTLMPAFAFDIKDKIHNGLVMAHMYFPGTADSDCPELLMTVTSASSCGQIGFGQSAHFESGSGEFRAVSSFYRRDPVTEILLVLRPNEAQRNSQTGFTMPAGTRIHVSITTNNATLETHNVN